MNISSSITIISNLLSSDIYSNIINNLADVFEPQILSVGSTNINKIPEDKISIAIMKNWSIA
jgi:hypothetical protein